MSLNLSNLEQIIDHDADNLEQIQYWYDQLIEYELEGNESPKDIETIFRAIKWIMQYEHTSAEELKEIAEKEAIEMAEKEENWEQEKEMLKEELSVLRERITGQAGINETYEAFRGEIDALKAENSQLKQLNRDRDRELSDQRDKAEQMSSRVDSLEKERTLLQAQLEDTIRELNRRISAKTEVSTKNEWESRRLRQRSEQAMQLSSQLQSVIGQNEQLKDEVERLSNALQNATALIQETTSKYGSLQEQLSMAEKTIENLVEDNAALKEQINTRDQILQDKQAKHELTSKEMEELLESKDQEILRLKSDLNLIMHELNDYRTRLQIEQSRDNNEAELERLSQELRKQVDFARQMFGTLTSEAPKDLVLDPTVELRLRLMQLEEQLQTTHEKIKELEVEKSDLEKTIEEKDASNAQLYADINRYRQTTFGDADKEIRHLETQLKFRDKQIQKLTSKCSLLQIELEKFIEKGPKTPKVSRPLPKEPINEKPSETTIHDPQKPTKVIAGDTTTKEKDQSRQETDTDRPKIVDEAPPKIQPTQEKLDELEAYASIIASLNHEVMQLLKEIESKDEQIRRMETMQRETDKCLKQSKAQVALLSNEFKKVCMNGDHDESEDQAVNKELRLQELEIKVVELERLNESITIDGSDFERRMEEATRRLIYIQIQNLHLTRSAETADRKARIANDTCENLRLRVRRLVLDDERRSRRLVLENELNTIEIARLQTSLLRSVPASQYNKLLKRFKSLLFKNVAGHELEMSVTDEDYHFENVTLISYDEKSFEELKMANKKLEEENRILTTQMDFWRNESEKSKANVDELNAFLTDIENQSKAKSMIVNIERRFLMAMNEQREIMDERIATDKELRKVQRELIRKRHQWNNDKRKLINAVMGLQNLVQRLKFNVPNNLTVDQMLSFRNATETLRNKEAELDEKMSSLDHKTIELEQQRILVESIRLSIQETLESNFDVARMQKALQNFAFNVQTLSNENRALNAQIRVLRNELEIKMAEFEELKEENERVLSTVVNLESQEPIEESAPKEKPKKERPPTENGERTRIPLESSTSEEEESSRSDDYDKKRPREVKSDRIQLKTVVFDNSKDYERRVEMVKETARLCIQSYKDQLEQKDRAIEQYRVMLENSRVNLIETPYEMNLRMPETSIKKSSEILNNLKLEEAEREVKKLTQEIQELERINAELGLQLKNYADATHVEKKRSYNVGVQTEPVSNSTINVIVETKTKGPSEESEESDREEETTEATPRQEYDEEFEESDKSSRSSSDAGTSDSGTVEDIDKPPSRRGSRTSSVSSNQGQNEWPGKPSGTKPNVPSLPPHSSRTDASENAVIRFRSEIRNLRSRLMALDRKNRELSTENDSLKSRTRFPTRTAAPDGESTFFKKDNDRLRREIKNLSSTIESKTNEINDLQKTIKRLSSIPHKDAVENWEEKKRKDKTIVDLRRKLEESVARESELAEKLERRERHLDQINREQNKRYIETERLSALTRELNQDKEAFSRRETTLLNEVRIRTEKCKEVTTRLEHLARENKSLRRSIPKRITSQDAYAQTNEVREEIETVRTPKVPKIPMQEIRTYRESFREDVQSLHRDLRRAQLREIELTDELRTVKLEYETLQKDYSSFITKERRRTNIKEGAAITVLRDKLMAKDHEVESLRYKINQLEQRILQMSHP